jgi:RNAse (barnase) inhibitor barstar
VRVVKLDGSRIESPEEFLDAVAAALEFPDYFGRNWNALDDCLLDINEPTVVEWTQASRFAGADPEEYAIALSCFADTSSPVELRPID